MLKILNSVTVLCILFQKAYLQDNYIYPPNSATGQYGTYPYWPFQVQTMNGNYSPNPRRYKKPCTRRMNSNNPISEDAGSQWIPTRTEKPLENNNFIFISRSLKDKDFNSKTPVASVKIESNTVTEKPLSQNVDEPDKSVSPNNDLCVTSTTTEDVASKLDTDYEQGPNHDFYDVVKVNNEQTQHEFDSKSVEVITDDCNNKIDLDGYSRRFITQNNPVLSKSPNSANDKHSDQVLKSNKIETKKEPQFSQSSNAIAPNLQAFEDSFESQLDESSRLGLVESKSNEIKGNLIDPTKGRGISHMADNKVMLMQNTKVCYACSSVSDPTCWNPDRRTTVKYCRVGHDSCVTKTIQNTNALTVIRDCARSCDDTDVTGLISRYKSCSICHYDLCNGAYSIKIYNFMCLSSFLAFLKYSL